MVSVEIGAADLINLADAAKIVEPQRRLQPTRLSVFPPVELYEVEPLLVEASQRLVDHPLDIRFADVRQFVEVRHKFGVDLDPG